MWRQNQRTRVQERVQSEDKFRSGTNFVLSLVYIASTGVVLDTRKGRDRLYRPPTPTCFQTHRRSVCERVPPRGTAATLPDAKNREEERKHLCAVSRVWTPNGAFVQSLTILLPPGCCSTARSLVSMSSNWAFALPGPDFSRASICRRRSAISRDSVCRRLSTVCRSKLIWECITCTVSGWVAMGEALGQGKADKAVAPQ